MTNMEAYDRMLDRFEKSKKLEEVSGQDIDSLISLFREAKVSSYICPKCMGSGSVGLGVGIRGIRVCSECNGKGSIKKAMLGSIRLKEE